MNDWLITDYERVEVYDQAGRKHSMPRAKAVNLIRNGIVKAVGKKQFQVPREWAKRTQKREAAG